MKDLIIVCDDSFGLDVKMIVLAINDFWEKQGWGIPYRLKGFITSSETKKNIEHLLPQHLGTIEEWEPAENEFFAMGILEPHRKKHAVELLKGRGAIFETIRAPWTLAHQDFKFPEGCIVAAQSIMDSAIIGKFAILYQSMISYDAVVGEYSSIMSFANIATAHIGKSVFIGDNAVVIRKTVNDDAVVLANSVVVKEVKAGTTVFGNPARRYKQGKEDLL